METEVEPVAQAAPRATYRDILDAPPNMIAQIIGGILYTMPRPVPEHGRASSSLLKRIGSSFDQGDDDLGGWWIEHEPEIHFTEEDVFVPDLAGWRIETMPVYPRGKKNFTVTPDWVCEMFSPSTRNVDKKLKSRVYAREGVSYMWLVDPDPKAQTLEAFVLRDGVWVSLALLSGDVEVCLPPFEGLNFPLRKLWPPVN